MATQTERQRTRPDSKPAWHVIDAEGKTLGRLSSEIAVLLQGKHKPTYVPYLNSGDFVVVLNAGKVRVTGKKLQQKMYYRHSGYHGGLKTQTLSEVLERAPERVIRHSVKGMLPKSILGRRMLSRLKLFEGDSHLHEAQVIASQKIAEEEAPPEPAPTLARAPAAAEAQDQVVAGPPAPEAAEPETAGETKVAKSKPARKTGRARATSRPSTESAAGAAEPEAAAEAPVSEETSKRKPRRPRPSTRDRGPAGADNAPPQPAPSTEEA